MSQGQAWPHWMTNRGNGRKRNAECEKQNDHDDVPVELNCRECRRTYLCGLAAPRLRKQPGPPRGICRDTSLNGTRRSRFVMAALAVATMTGAGTLLWGCFDTPTDDRLTVRFSSVKTIWGIEEGATVESATKRLDTLGYSYSTSDNTITAMSSRKHNGLGFEATQAAFTLSPDGQIASIRARRALSMP